MIDEEIERLEVVVPQVNFSEKLRNEIIISL
jgi:hypothetical protein